MKVGGKKEKRLAGLGEEKRAKEMFGTRISVKRTHVKWNWSE